MMISKPRVFQVLVGFSLLLLAMFLYYWNMENYQREKKDLTSDIQTQMQLSCSTYRDSLVQKIFRVVVKDSIPHLENNMRFPSFLSRDSSNGMQNILIEERHIGIGNEGKEKREKLSFQISVDSDEKQKDSTIVVWQTDSTSLRFEYSDDTVKETITQIRFDHDPLLDFDFVADIPRVYYKIDSIFSRNLLANGITIPHVISNANQLVTDGEIAVTYNYDSFGVKQKPVAVFSDYRGFLWKRLSSQLLMSLILFSVVALSFLAILNTWLKQLKMAEIKNEFISNMTHELKTPIATVGVALEALQEFGADADPLKRAEYLDISKHELNRLKILVDKVLKMSTLEKNDLLTKSEMDLQQMLEETISSMRLQFEKHEVLLNVNIADSDFTINGDSVHLTNVVYNLLDNAMKYNQNPRAIDISLSANDKQVILVISDNGQGIPPKYKSKIFDRFFRVPTKDIHNVKGHGLGLHYVSKIIEQHKGSISVDSQSEVGSTFVIKLPKKS